MLVSTILASMILSFCLVIIFVVESFVLIMNRKQGRYKMDWSKALVYWMGYSILFVISYYVIGYISEFLTHTI